MWVLGYSNAFSALWPIFGTANQLLAALGLLAVSSWLLMKGKKYSFALIPAIFMIITTITSLLILLSDYLSKGNYILIATDIFLLILSVGVVILVFKKFFKQEPKTISEAIIR
jgi:carbon starvation protein